MKNKPYPYYEIETYETFEQLLTLVKNKYGNKILFRTKKRKNEETVTYNRLYDDVLKLSAYFGNTYGTGQKIAVVGENSYQWILTYFAVVCSGNVIVPLDKELASADIADLLNDCESKILVHSDDYDDIADDVPKIIPDFKAIAMSELNPIISSIENASFAVTTPDDLAIIVYTSGTTGKSKGVMLSQRNICADMCCCCKTFYFEGRTLALLPLHHTFAMLVNVLLGIYYGVEILICPSLKNVMADINDFKPTWLSVVPMIVEKVDKGILDKIEKGGKTKIVGIMSKVSNALCAIGIDLRKKLFSSVRNGLGGELEFIISGGAPIDQIIIDRFNTYGITLLNGYGISECSPVVSVNRRYHYRAGSVGQPLYGVNVMIDNPNENGEGEVCVKSDIVMKGYYNMPEETEAVMKDGWFHTGDIGKIDNEGFIYITGRLKNLIILSNGKNVSPEELETLIGRISGVAEVLVYSDNSKLIAEIYADEEFRATQSDIQAYFDEQIDKLNDTLPPYKAIAKVIIRDTEFEKTTTKKIKRIYKK